jgi:hypothetical protein
MGISRNGVFKMFPNKLGACPATSHIDPFGQARAFFAFDILDISVAAAAAANAVLLLFVPVLPVVILFDTVLLVSCGQFEVRLSRKLSGRSIRWAVLNSGVSVTKVTEVVNILGT